MTDHAEQSENSSENKSEKKPDRKSDKKSEKNSGLDLIKKWLGLVAAVLSLGSAIYGLLHAQAARKEFSCLTRSSSAESRSTARTPGS